MKKVALRTLPAVALLLGFSSLTGFDGTTGDSHTVLAQNQSQPDRDFRPPPPIDFAAAAKQLGVTEAELIEALGLPPKPPPPLDISGAAKKLGVTEAELIKILGIPPRPPGRDI